MVLMLRANYGLIGCPGAKLWDKWGQGVLLRDTSSAYCRCTLYLMYVPVVLLRNKSGLVFCCGTNRVRCFAAGHRVCSEISLGETRQSSRKESTFCPQNFTLRQ